MNVAEGWSKMKTESSIILGLLSIFGDSFQEGGGDKSLSGGVGREKGGEGVVMVSLYDSLEMFLSERKHRNGSVAGEQCGMGEKEDNGRRNALEEMGEDSGNEWWCWP